MHDRHRCGPTFDDSDTVRTWLTAREDCAASDWSDRLRLGGGFALMLAPAGGFAAAGVNDGTAAKDIYSESFLTAACPVVATYGAKDPGNQVTGP
jgi:hypothetical protein